MANTEERDVARIAALDVTRGIAILGILAVNANWFAHEFFNDRLTSWPLPASQASLASYWIVQTFIQGKFLTLFAMLFGASLCIIVRGRDPAARRNILIRRLGWLAVLGAGHAMLLFIGDILLAYAIAGSLAALFVSVRARTLLILGACVLAVVVAYTIALDIQAAPYELPAPSPRLPHQAGYAAGFLAARSANLTDWLNAGWHQMTLFQAQLAAPLMLLGMGLFKVGVLAGTASGRTYAWLAAAGCVALVAMAAVGALQVAGNPFALNYDSTSIELTAPFIAIGYFSVIALIVRAAPQGWLVRVFAPVGRMALTNYIAQSLAMSAIFNGAGLYGRLDRPAILAIVLAVWIAQITASHLWLRWFGKGPLEAVWHRLTYAGVAATR